MRKLSKLAQHSSAFLISVDHYFRMSSELYKGFLKYERCASHGEEFWSTAKIVYIEQRSVLFKVIQFQYWHIPIFEWLHVSRRVAWGFSEVIIIVLAMNLSMKFQQFNERLSRVRFQTLWHSYWKEMYDHYLMLCNLVDIANDFVSPVLIVITFADFFFLCERLYRQYVWVKCYQYENNPRTWIILGLIMILLEEFISPY